VHELEKRGLVAAIEQVQVDDGHLDGIVVDQTPIGDGSRVVDVGATVTIYVGTFEGNGSGGGNGNGNGDSNGNGDGNGNGGGDGGGGEASPAMLPDSLPRRPL
jgi:hypothetical protein